MDFARKQLEKYGWTDGKGLGKNENGISVPLKPKIKRSVAGVGHDLASEFTEHWWTKLYDKAAGNVEVHEKDGKTKKIKIKDEKFKITANTWQIESKHTDKQTENQDGYSEYFIKKAILTSGGSKTERVRESDSESECESEKRDVLKLTDEELFAACEGRTAHKGARHGLKAAGKLARIERQESILLAQPKYKGYSHADKMKKNKQKFYDITTDNSNSDVEKTIKKKKKHKHCIFNAIVDRIENGTRNSGDTECSDIHNEIGIDNVYNVNTNEISVKKSKKEKLNVVIDQNNDDELLAEAENNDSSENSEINVQSVSNNKIKKKNKKHKKYCTDVKDHEDNRKNSANKIEPENDEVLDNDGIDIVNNTIRNRKKQKSTTDLEGVSVENTLEHSIDSDPNQGETYEINRKLKKRKLKEFKNENLVQIENSIHHHDGEISEISNEMVIDSLNDGRKLSKRKKSKKISDNLNINKSKEENQMEVDHNNQIMEVPEDIDPFEGMKKKKKKSKKNKL